MHIFLDESGNFTKHNNKTHFVIATLSSESRKKTEKAFSKWIRTRFPKRKKLQSEIKWSSSDIVSDLRFRTLEFIARQDIDIKYGYLNVEHIPGAFLGKKNKVHSGQLYVAMVIEVLQTYNLKNHSEVHILCDKRSLKGITNKEFRQQVEAALFLVCKTNTRIQVETIDSRHSVSIQIADWIAGALAYYHNQEPSGTSYFEALEKRISTAKEFHK